MRLTLLPSAAQAPTDLGQLASHLPWPVSATATVICFPQTTVSRSFSRILRNHSLPELRQDPGGARGADCISGGEAKGRPGAYCVVMLATAGRGEISCLPP